MDRLIRWYRQQTQTVPGGRIAALDGVRAVLVFSVVAYHYWQHSWYTPGFTLLGRFISLDPFLRTGYMWVDGMLLLSGFLLYLPYARAQAGGQKPLGFDGFYKRRFFRIMPTYALNLLVVFLVVALPRGSYRTVYEALRDWAAHLTFTHPLFYFSNISTPLNGVLWTLGVEVQFYLIFPLLARGFRRMPLLTWCLAAGAAFSYRAFAMTRADSAMLVNQLPGFLDVYLNGFVAAAVYARLEKQGREDGFTRVMMSAVLFCALIGLAVLVRFQAGNHQMHSLRVGQMMIRFPQSVLTALAFLGAALGVQLVRLLFGNRLTAFLAAISYQVYMWHQVIAGQLKHWRIPPSQAANPHMTGETAWQIGFLLLCLGLTLFISAAVTYGVEQPILRRAAARK